MQVSFDFYSLEAKPEHLIGNRAYDSDQLDDDLKQDDVNMITPIGPRKNSPIFAVCAARRITVPLRQF